MPPLSDISVFLLLILGLGSMIGVVVWLGMLTQNKDNASEIQKNLAIVAGVTGCIIILFAVASYMYFSANTNYVTPFLLIMTYINMFLSLFATSASTLQVVKS